MSCRCTIRWYTWWCIGEISRWYTCWFSLLWTSPYGLVHSLLVQPLRAGPVCTSGLTAWSAKRKEVYAASQVVHLRCSNAPQLRCGAYCGPALTGWSTVYAFRALRPEMQKGQALRPGRWIKNNTHTASQGLRPEMQQYTYFFFGKEKVRQKETNAYLGP